MTAVDVSNSDGALRLPTVRGNRFDPSPQLSELRGRTPLCRLRFPDDHDGWLVTSYELSRAVLADQRFSMKPDRSAVPDSIEAMGGGDPEYRRCMSDIETGTVVAQDPPQHTRLRRLQTSYFTVRRVREQRTVLEEIVSQRLAAIEAAGPPVDLVPEFAWPIPSLAICHMLGIPYEERERFESPHETFSDPHADALARQAGLIEFYRYAHELIERKRVTPGDDLLSELIAAGELTDAELIGVATQLISAGHHTTANMIALSTFFLLAERSLWERLREHREFVPAAVEELLRYLTLVQTGAFARTATEAVEIGRTRIEAGETVWVSLAAANRDPAHFPLPDRFDIDRDAAGHLAFGHGRHMCLGQHLARFELELALLGLLERFPTLALAVPDDEVALYHGDHQLYGVHALPVVW